MKKTRNTQAKTAVLELINQSSKALSQPEIQSQLEDVCDRVTIYRILNRLVSEGLIHKVLDSDGASKYAPCKKCTTHEHHHHNHIHFSCSKCKTVTCLETVIPKFELPQNYKVDEMHFTVSGICPTCLEN